MLYLRCNVHKLIIPSFTHHVVCRSWYKVQQYQYKKQSMWLSSNLEHNYCYDCDTELIGIQRGIFGIYLFWYTKVFTYDHLCTNKVRLYRQSINTYVYESHLYL